MTSAEQLRYEGIQQGIEKGIEKGRQETILQLQRSGLEITEIARLLNLPLEQVKYLAQ